MYSALPKRIVREIVTKKRQWKLGNEHQYMYYSYNSLRATQWSWLKVLTTYINIENGFSVRQTSVGQLLERF